MNSLVDRNRFGAAEIDAENEEHRVIYILPIDAHNAATLPHVIRLVQHEVQFTCEQ